MAAPAQRTTPSLTERLQRSVLAGMLAFDSVVRMQRAHLRTVNSEDAQRLLTFVQTSQKSLWAKHSASLGSLQNGKVAVRLSTVAPRLQGSDQKPRLLGLFAAEAISKGDWVTAYGGVQEWPGSRRSQNKNTHSRRIPESSWIWNGRPWALLFSLDKNSRDARLLLSSLSLVNLLLQLEHETFHVGEATTVLELPCVKDAAGNTPGHTSADCQDCGAAAVQTLPSCGCCGLQLGLFPCEFAVIFSSWSLHDQQACESLVADVRKRIEQEGVGFMANTSSNKADLNVQCIAVSPYTAAMAAIHPKQLIYQATRDIAAGGEILVAYNNNESKQF